jgi:single-strand DNA-binding protein
MFTGNLTRDVELRDVGSTKVGSFGLAVSEKWRAKDGTEKVETAFFDCEAWGKQAETIAKYFKKGTPITVITKAKMETWVDKATGGKRSKIKFRVEDFKFIPKTKSDKQENNDEGGDGAPETHEDGGEPTPF